MRVCHVESAVFDDPNLMSCGGLAPVVALAQRCGLAALVGTHLSLPSKGGANAPQKVSALVGGMVIGADSIRDMDVLRHGGMGRLFDGVRAPSTLGTFLRTFTFGHVRQLDGVAARLLSRLAAVAPVLPGGDVLAFIDVDDTVKATYGYAKQGAGYGYTGVKGLNALIATVSSPLAAPLIVGTRLRKGSANSARGASRLVADAVRTARAAGAGGGPDGTGLIVLRADSAYYGYPVIAAARRAGARFSVTARASPTVRRAIESIDETAWQPIHYPHAVWDEQAQRLVSDAEIAEVAFTAFTGRRKAEHIPGRLLVRRVRRLNTGASKASRTRSSKGASAATSPETGAQQGELFAAYRYHAVFTDSPLTLVQAEKDHRGHAIIEQVHADLRSGPLAHLPSGSFTANSAWLILAAIAFNLTRAAGVLASTFHAKATTSTIRTQLINVPTRLARSARRLRLHLPEHWPWEHAWQQLFQATLAPAPS